MSGDDRDSSSSAALPAASRATRRFIQFSLGMLLLVFTTIAVGLGSLRSFPLLAVLLLFWIVPALLHAHVACRLLYGTAPLEVAQRLDRFGLGLVYVCLALLVALGTGWVATLLLWTLVLSQSARTLPVRPAEALLPWIIGTAGVCGLLAGGWIFWITLPRTEPAE
jgi:hypothetical protein